NDGSDRVWVNNRAVVRFANYPIVNLDGQFGADQFSVSPAGLSATVTTINVSGGDSTLSGSPDSDALLVTGTTGADTVTVAATSLLSGGQLRMIGLRSAPPARCESANRDRKLAARRRLIRPALRTSLLKDSTGTTRSSSLAITRSVSCSLMAVI